jgi:glyceraldehyde 3-phosphate dehydrogenase
MSTSAKESIQESSYERELSKWISDEKAAIELIHIVGQLWFEKSIELVIFRNQLVDRSASEILNLHNYAGNIVGREISIHDTLILAGNIYNLDIAPARLDIGRLATEWLNEKATYSSSVAFITDKLSNFIGKDKRVLKPKDVILYGFGRIGRIAAREIIAQAGKGEQLRLRAIVTRSDSDEDIIKRAALLRTDSVHGPFPGTVLEDLENKSLIINGHRVKMIAAANPATIDYEQYGIHQALLIDNTGATRERGGLSEHLKSKGVEKVLLTAPGKGDIPNIVYGCNHGAFDKNIESVFSAASCTTNAIVPVLKVIQKNLGIQGGHIETIHSYTNDQNLLDNYHKKYRRGRSAALNMVITETGAGSAVSKVIPELAGKLTSNSVRVPTPNVSLAILSLRVQTDTSRDDVNSLLRNAALHGDLVEQIQFSVSNELVSSDLVGNPCASIVDSPATIVAEDKRNIILYVWYDNEYGYTRQVIRLSKHLSDVIRLTYY